MSETFPCRGLVGSCNKVAHVFASIRGCVTPLFMLPWARHSVGETGKGRGCRGPAAHNLLSPPGRRSGLAGAHGRGTEPIELISSRGTTESIALMDLSPMYPLLGKAGGSTHWCS